MKKVNCYSDEFKSKVVKAVLSGVMSRKGASRKYGIGGHSTVSEWINKHRLRESYMRRHGSCIEQLPKTMTDQSEELLRLRKELEQERIQTRLLEKLIEVAEQEYKISIRKKSGAKQCEE